MLFRKERKPEGAMWLNGKARNSNCGFKYVLTHLRRKAVFSPHFGSISLIPAADNAADVPPFAGLGFAEWVVGGT